VNALNTRIEHRFHSIPRGSKIHKNNNRLKKVDVFSVFYFKRSYFKEWLEINPTLVRLFANSTNSLNRDVVKESVAMLNVYYDDLHYMFIQESPLFTDTSLLGIIGSYFFKGNFRF